ncbi:MAG: hypothetical protein IJC38_06890 [Erysipelotrichaceae bacterium]|nr:hypothetical protein [Erysipelotrichaceae bacterium]
MSEHNSKDKLELAEKIASQTRKVTKKYEDVESMILHLVRWFSTAIDRFLFNPKMGGAISLILALMIFALVNYNEDSSLFGTAYLQSTTLSNQPIIVDYNSDKWEITVSDEICDVVLTGDASSLSMQTASSNYSIVADLNNLSSGTHTVKLQAKDFISGIRATVSPSDVSVTIKEKVTQNYSIGYDFINTAKMENIYALGTPVFESTRVAIRASEDTLSTVAFVKALIDVGGQTSQFEQNAQLVAYDQNGNPVKCDIKPETVKVTVPVTSPKKEVPVIIEPQGEVPNDMAIESITLDHNLITVFAPETVLSRISDITITFDAASLTGDKKLVKGITLPSNVNAVNINSINMDVKLGEKVSKVIENVPINYRNYSNTFKITTDANVEVYTSVTVYGTQTNVDKITAADLNVYIDFEGYGAGKHDIPIHVEQNPSALVSFTADKATISMTLTDENAQSSDEQIGG